MDGAGPAVVDRGRAARQHLGVRHRVSDQHVLARQIRGDPQTARTGDDRGG
jgi:hypothetical protein